MSEQKVTYELSLKDSLTPTVEKANALVNKLEHGMHSLGERVLKVGEAFGISFGIFKGIEFVKEAKEEWEKLEFANSQLEAGLESTGHAAGIALEELKESAEGFSHTFKFTKAEVEDMQSILLTFPSVTKATFNDASQAVLDMATRMGTDAKSAALQLGKALQDPVAGIAALHRVGVNTEELKKKFETVTDTLQRQRLIIKELNEEFGGSAKAAAEADVSFRYEKSMQELSETVGQLAVRFTAVLAPALEGVANLLKDSIRWAEKHKDLLKAIAIGAATAASAWLIYQGVLLGVAAASKITYWWEMMQLTAMEANNIMQQQLTLSTTLVTAAQWAWNAAISANPLVLLVVAIGAVVAAVVYCYKHFGTFRAVLWASWAVIKEFGSMVVDSFKSVYHVLHGIFTFNLNEIKDGLSGAIGFYTDAAKRLGQAAAKGYKEGMEDFEKDQKEKEKESLVPKKTYTAKPIAQGTAVKEPKTKASGSKSVTINVQIKDLIGTQNINTTTLKEGAGKIRDMVVSVLTGAVNDFQVVAEH